MSTFYRILVCVGLFIGLFLFVPSIALGHERWFVPDWQRYRSLQPHAPILATNRATWTLADFRRYVRSLVSTTARRAVDRRNRDGQPSRNRGLARRKSICT